MKIVLCEFRQESNSFNPIVAGRYSFEMGGICEGESFIRKIEKEPCAAAGMLHTFREAGVNLIPTYSMVSQSGGPVEQQLVEAYWDKLSAMIKANLPLDGVMMSLHGATQAEKWEDVCGELLERIRIMVGEKAVIAVSCDMHANVTDKMLANADFVSGYLSYPHTDYYDVGCRAARLALRKLGGEEVHMTAMRVPMIVPASGYTTLQGEYKTFVDEAKAFIENGTILDFSVFQMQPWLDVSVGGSTVIAVAKDAAVASDVAHRFGDRLFNMRELFKSNLYSMDEVFDIARTNTSGKPVVLVDSADSSNAGAVGDNAAVIKHLLERGETLKTAIYLNDGPAADKAIAVGVGNEMDVTIGGSIDRKYSSSVAARVRVKHIFTDGTFTQSGPAGKGLINNIGPTAVLTMGNISILVCHNTAGNGDLQLYRGFGIEPAEQQLVVVKACTSHRAAYSLISDMIYPTNTPGAACADLIKLKFSRLPSDFYPFCTAWKTVPVRAIGCRNP